MKKATALLFLLLVNVSLIAQKVDFFQFAKQFDWKEAKGDIIRKYQSFIVDEKTFGQNPFDSMNGVFLKGFVVGEYDAYVGVLYLEEATVLLAIPESVFDESVSSTILTSRLSRYCAQVLGSPDISKNDIDLTKLAIVKDLEIESGSIDVWIKESVSFIFLSATTYDEHVSAVVAIQTDMLSSKYADNPDLDFRVARWGDTREYIMRKEGKKDELDLENIYAFHTNVAGFSCLCGYRFTENILTSAKYIFDYLNTDNCIREYNQLENMLSSKYGKPADVERKNTASESDKRYYTDGELVRKGKLQMSTTWVTPYSMIFLVLSGENHTINLSIGYYSIKYMDVREKDILKDL